MNWKSIAGAVVVAALFLPVRAEALETNELLALVAMPLAVAAVSEVTDVPMSDLMDVVTLLNDANVPPVQFVEVVRYAPVALVVEQPTRTPFVEFVRTRYQGGIIGVPLVTEIEREIRFYGLPDVELDVVAPRVIVRNEDFIPAPVRTQLVTYRRSHPHGGPQTGAEVVHRDRAPKVKKEHDRDKHEVKVEKHQEKHEQKHVEKQEKHHGGGKSNGGGKGKGKGKG